MALKSCLNCNKLPNLVTLLPFYLSNYLSNCLSISLSVCLFISINCTLVSVL